MSLGKWTHKVAYKDDRHEMEWVAAFIGGELFVGDIGGTNEIPPGVRGNRYMGLYSIEGVYNGPGYQIKKIVTFKGNK